ncbi:unnamed protein product [Spirodela intermedia]|uniref:ResB-like domain-containing protein n=1 Tax=Spirodela intermedia TaxID=51605 RepID=A0A7I8IK18_SPIIN|nr:unnamed protein product [Spirodela intermedia]CAA6657710.1 unnamed protein product [Spirodela intermedia]
MVGNPPRSPAGRHVFSFAQLLQNLGPRGDPVAAPLRLWRAPSQLFISKGHDSYSKKRLLLRIGCKVRTSKETAGRVLPEDAKKVALPSAAPPLSGDGGGSRQESGRVSVGNQKLGSAPLWVPLKRVRKKILALLSNLPLAIGEMFTIAALMALGTCIDQGEAPDYYFQKFPEESPVLGFITWKWILYLGFDHMFSSPVFLGMLALLAASLMACTYTTQIPMVKVARRWSFMHSAERIRKQEFSDTLPQASIQDLGVILMGGGYEVPISVCFQGLAGRFAPIGVHLAMLLIMAGATVSATGSFRGSVTVPQGLNFVVGDVMVPNGFLANPIGAFDTEVHVNRFYMEYYDSGEIWGVTIYQTDWSISALQVIKDGEGPFNLAMAPLKINGDKKLYGTILPVGDLDSPNVKGISMLARDLQSIVLYDQEGKFVGVRRPSSKLPIEIDGSKIIIEDAIGSSGLDLKTDPGVPVVYAGFGALMLTTCISYLAHSQIWALQDGTTVVIGGKSNRAKLEFPEEINRLLDRVPELVGVDDFVSNLTTEQRSLDSSSP